MARCISESNGVAVWPERMLKCTFSFVRINAITLTSPKCTWSFRKSICKAPFWLKQSQLHSPYFPREEVIPNVLCISVDSINRLLSTSLFCREMQPSCILTISQHFMAGFQNAAVISSWDAASLLQWLSNEESHYYFSHLFKPRCRAAILRNWVKIKGSIILWLKHRPGRSELSSPPSSVTRLWWDQHNSFRTSSCNFLHPVLHC